MTVYRYLLTATVAAATVLCVGAAQAATWYVSPSGSDGNSGSQSSPFLTIAHADSAASAGDTVLVASGTYTGDFTLSHGGSASAPITIAAQTIGGAKLVGSNYSLMTVQANYIVINGFDLQAAGGHGVDVESSHHITIENCIAHNCGGSGIETNYSEYISVIGNTCYGNANTNGYQCSGISLYEQRALSDSNPGFHNIVRGNVCYNNIETYSGSHTDGNGIIIDDFHNGQTGYDVNYPYQTLVEDNVCYYNGGKGIQVYVSDNVTVRNNTVYWNNRDNQNTGTWRGELNCQNSANSVFSNNIADTNPAYNSNNSAILVGSVSFNDGSTNFYNNLTFNGTVGSASVQNGGSQISVTAANGNVLGKNPNFVNASVTSPNFALLSGSPAIGAGTTGGSSTAAQYDILGNLWASGVPVDMGAYKYTSGTSNPAPTLTAMSPSSATAGANGVTLTATGSGFVSGSTVYWNGAALATTFVSSTNLTASVPNSDVATAGTASVSVKTPTPGGGTSASLTFTVNAAGSTAQYDFESGIQGWGGGGGYITGVAQSSAEAFTGSHSLAVTISSSGTGTSQVSVSSPTTPAGKTITFHVWIPSNSTFTWVQAYAQTGNYTWIGDTISNLTKGGWNTFTVAIPSNAVTPLYAIGVQFDRTTTFSGTCYIDSVSW